MPMDKTTVASISKEAEGSHFVVKEEDQSNTYKFNQPSDSSTKVIINRNEDFGLELPTITKEFDTEKGFDLIFCNLSESSCASKTPAQDIYRDDANIPSFKSRNYKYINPDKLSNSYDRFKDTSKIEDSSMALNDGDFVLLDGSVSEPRFRSFETDRGKYDFQERYRFADYSVTAKKGHKFSAERMEKDLDLYGEMASYISFAHTSHIFTVNNHEMSTGQKFIFNCDKVIVADHYYNGTFDSNAAVANGVGAGQTVLVYNHDLSLIHI